MNKIKKIIVNTMISTGAVLVILSIFFIFLNLNSMSIYIIFQIFGANIVINCGLSLLSKLESRYAIVEYLRDVSCIIIVLIVFGAVFGWYSLIPVWVLVIMAVAIYVFMVIISTVKTRNDTRKINNLLRKRREKYLHTPTA